MQEYIDEQHEERAEALNLAALARRPEQDVAASIIANATGDHHMKSLERTTLVLVLLGANTGLATGAGDIFIGLK